MEKQFVYSFNEGSKDMRDILGGKGANLAEMTKIGLPVPFGFTVSTEACKKYYEDGEKLYLEGDLIREAESVQQSAMEQDDRRGPVEEYLEMLLPDNWDSMDTFARRNYIESKNDPTRPKDTKKRDEVSNVEIWAECFERNVADLKPTDSYSIAAIMTQIPGWERSRTSKKIPLYGKQRLYVREQ